MSDVRLLLIDNESDAAAGIVTALGAAGQIIRRSDQPADALVMLDSFDPDAVLVRVTA